MDLWYLALVFIVIVIIMSFKKPLYMAILGGLAATVLLFGIGPGSILQQSLRVFTEWSSLQVMLSLYLITMLQRMLEKRQMIKKGQQALDRLFRNRRATVSIAPIFIGMLPSAAAMNLCADVIGETSSGHLEPRQQSFLTSWMRHMPECMLPTNSSVLLLLGIAGMSASRFMLAMLVPAIVLWLIVYIPYIRRIPREPKTEAGGDRKTELKELFRQFWPLLLLISMIMLLGVEVVTASAITLAAMVLVYRFPAAELLGFAKSAFEWNIQLTTFLLFLLKDLLDITGVIAKMPDALSQLPIPLFMVFVLLFFTGTLVAGAPGIIALGAPIAFAALGADIPTMVLIMGISHAAHQIAPVHICLEISACYYKLSMGEHIRKSILPSLVFTLFVLGYYQLLLALC